MLILLVRNNFMRNLNNIGSCLKINLENLSIKNTI